MSLRTRWTLALAAGSAALLMAAACGSNGDSGASDDGTGGAPAGASAYLDCLHEQGIDISNTFPSGPGGGNRDADAAYRNCLADRGIDLRANPATTDAKVAEAMEARAVLRPNATPTP